MIDATATTISDQALAIIEGESCAREYLRRMEAGTAQPGDLATLMCYLDGEMLMGACSVLCKALEGRQHA